jgi:hypothetical protein
MYNSRLERYVHVVAGREGICSRLELQEWLHSLQQIEAYGENKLKNTTRSFLHRDGQAVASGKRDARSY